MSLSINVVLIIVLSFVGVPRVMAILRQNKQAMLLGKKHVKVIFSILARDFKL